MKKILYLLAIVLFSVGLHSCSDDDAVKSLSVVDGDIIRLSFSTSISDQVKVSTRALDPTGTGINTLWLFNFDKDGVFLGRTQAQVAVQGQTEGEFSASVPSMTRVVHLLANQNLDSFDDNDMNGRHENYVMNGLVSTSGGIVYWGRVDGKEIEEPKKFAELFGETITLYRNLARITCTVNGGTVQGMTICNKYAYGASIPFGASGYPTATPDFVTLPDNKSKLKDETDVEPITDGGVYIFESPNTGEDEMYVIVKINGKYYKIMLLDGVKEPLPIIRNHSYNIQFTTAPAATDGYDDFASAQAGAAYNNILISIDEDVPSITVDGVTLSVGETTTLVCTTSGSWSIPFYYNGTEDVKVTWISNDGVTADVMPQVTQPDSNDSGTIKINVSALSAAEVHRGKLQVKAGRLVRYINVYAVPSFHFTPVWTSNGISNQATGEDMGIVFNIPENYPEELLPVRCLITADQLNGSGIPPLAVIHYEDYDKEGKLDEYGEENASGYKFVYEAHSIGMHRIYFQTKWTEEETGTITLEAKYFDKVEKTYYYTERENNQLRIVGETDDDIREYTGEDVGSANQTSIYYKLVPRFKDSPVEFNLKYGAKGSEQDLPSGIQIMIYTSNLLPTGDIEGLESGKSPDGMHYYVYTTKGSDDRLTFKTKSPLCKETVRFASLNSDNEELPGDYKSTTLELDNFRDWESELTLSPSSVSYGVEREVKLSFNLKRFTSTDVHGGQSIIVGVPTGQYHVYIYTENLDWPNHEPLVDDDGRRYYEYDAPNVGNFTLAFKTNRIVSGETVTIKPCLDEISFQEATATFDNTPITGEITYGEAATEVPAGSFVTLIRKDGTRIGTVTITKAGQYSLTLRNEYSFGWEDPLYMYYAVGTAGVGDNTIYTSADGAITLKKLVDDKATTVALTEQE